jgi:hypothetical protein
MAFLQTVTMISMPAPTLRLPKSSFTAISVAIMINHSRLPQLLSYQPLQLTALPRRSISRLATGTFLRRSQTRFKSTSSSLVKISTLVIHCDGGPVTVRSSLTCLGLQGIFFRFRVSSQLIAFLSFSSRFMQDLLLLLNVFSQEAVIQSLCAVQVSTRRPSEL